MKNLHFYHPAFRAVWYVEKTAADRRRQFTHQSDTDFNAAVLQGRLCKVLPRGLPGLPPRQTTERNGAGAHTFAVIPRRIVTDMFLDCGINLYYEKAGEGAPLILVHGNGEDHTVFDRLIPRLAELFTVYAVDSPGHGRSQRPGEFHYAGFAETLSAFIGELGLERPFFCGFSDGGIIGLLLASSQPALLSRMAVCGANLTPAGLKRGWRALFHAEFLLTRRPLLKMMLDEPQIAEEALARIEIPTLVLAGGRDLVRESETRAIAEGIPGAALQILPGETHGSYVIHSDKLFPLLRDFFLPGGAR